MRLVIGPSGDDISELVDRLRERYQFNPVTPSNKPSVMYNRLVLKESLDLLGQYRAEEALRVFNSKMPRILGKVLGRIPGAVGFDPRDDVDCANNNFVKFAGFLNNGNISASEGIEDFIDGLKQDSTYL